MLYLKKLRSCRCSWEWLVLFLILVIVVGVRLRLCDVPLERDEGEYAYAGQLMLKRIPPYQFAYNMKFPGVYAAYALIMALFGQNPAGIHVGLLLVNVAAILLVFLLTRRCLDGTAGLLAAGFYAYASLSPQLFGTSAHATHFVIMPALAGLLLMLRGVDSSSKILFVLAGGLCGVATLMKQHGAAFVVFGLAYIVYRNANPTDWARRGRAQVGAFLSGVSLPFAVTGFLLWRAGVFSRFWFWTIEYAREYAIGYRGPAEIIAKFGQQIPPVVALALGFSLVGLRLLWCKGDRSVAVFAGGFLLFSALAVCPGFHFRNHYFVLVLPALGFSLGAFSTLARRLVLQSSHPVAAHLLSALPVALLFFGVFCERFFFFQASPVEACRVMYASNPFPESLPIAEFIRNHTKEDAQIAVLGSEPQLYFYSNRRSATGYIYTYPLTEPHPFALQMQSEMIKEIETAQPEYIVWVQVTSSWIFRPASEMLIVQWADQFLRSNYDQVGIVDILPGIRASYRWGDRFKQAEPLSNTHLTIHRRKSLRQKDTASQSSSRNSLPRAAS